MAIVSEIRTLTGTVEERPHVVANAVVLTRIGAAVILSRTSNLDGDAAQTDDVVRGGGGGAWRRAGDDPVIVDHHVLHAADEEGDALGQDPQEGRGAAQYRHAEARLRRVDGFHRVDRVQRFLFHIKNSNQNV